MKVELFPVSDGTVTDQGALPAALEIVLFPFTPEQDQAEKILKSLKR